MENGARYKVKTRYGWFSLDEGSYQDYLKGRLWINWPPENKESGETSEDLPPKVEKKALELRDIADRQGWSLAVSMIEGAHMVHVPFAARLSDVSIEELELTVRSSNGLMRAGLNTFGRLKQRLECDGGILTIRNLGAKSAAEIRAAFCSFCYSRLLPYEKACYWQDVLDKVNQKV